MDELIRTLVGEHVRMRELLRQAKESADSSDFEAVSRDLRQLEPVFKQHIADEEATVLRLLIGTLGRAGAEDEIKVFQQHRPIYKLMQTVSELAAKNAVELRMSQEELNGLFDVHAGAEEGRVFPKALSCVREK